MEKNIDKIYYFDYSKDIGFYDSFRQFQSREIEYIGLALSTPKIRIHASPIRYTINQKGTAMIQGFVAAHLQELSETDKETAKQSEKYILVCYSDDSEQYFQYNEEFCKIFDLAKEYEVKADTVETNTPSPYMIQTDSWVPPTLQTKSQNHPSSTMPFGSTTQTQTSKNTTKERTIFIGVAIVLAVFILMLCINSAVSNSYSVSSEPASGTILSGTEYYYGSNITISASGGESCVVKLKNANGITRLSFYVRAGDTVTIGVPDEYLYVYFASGDTWYGTERLFGNDTSYSMDDELVDFTKYSWKYTLYPVSSGNFSQTPINASQFK